MPVYSGRFEYRSGPRVAMQGACRVQFDAENVTLTPADGAPISFDWGDVDALTPSDWSAVLTLYTGKQIELKQFGPAFRPMVDEALSKWRGRTVRCLLLEDLERVAAYDAAASLNGDPPAPAHIRIFKSNIAVLPACGTPFQWRLADVDEISFEDSSYSVVFRAGESRLAITKLAKKTELFAQEATNAWSALRAESAMAMHRRFPFLEPDEIAQLSGVMPEGRSAPLANLGKINAVLEPALMEQAVSRQLAPYFEKLRSIANQSEIACGFKFIREGEDAEVESARDAAEQPAAEEQESAQPGGEPQPLFFWFFIPLADSRLIAWEATTGTGRATYLFRANPEISIAAAIATLTRGLAAVNFRREPVYASDDVLRMNPKFHRYAIGARRIPELRALREAFVGRAGHTSVDEWEQQVRALTQSDAQIRANSQ